MVKSSDNQSDSAMFIICMYQIVEIMRFSKVGAKTEFNSPRVYLNSLFNLIKSEGKICGIETLS